MEFSTLNGYKVKDKKAIRYYDTVNDMKSDTTLKNGMHVKTKGYYSVNDGGGSEYYITNTSSETEFQEQLNNNLYGELIPEKEISSICFGDPLTADDDSEFLQLIFDYTSSKKLHLNLRNNKTYNIGSHIKINSDLYVDFNSSTFKMNNNTNSEFLYNTDNFTTQSYVVKNITLLNGVFDGNNTNNITGNLTGMCVVLYNGDNLKVNNFTIKNCQRNCFNIYETSNIEISDINFQNISTVTPADITASSCITIYNRIDEEAKPRKGHNVIIKNINVDNYAWGILFFLGVHNITVENLKGINGVLGSGIYSIPITVTECEYLTFNNIYLDTTSTVAFEVNQNTKYLNANNVIIKNAYQCLTFGPNTKNDSINTDIKFTNCVFEKSASGNYWLSVNNTHNLIFENCQNNESGIASSYTLIDDIIFKNCKFTLDFTRFYIARALKIENSYINNVLINKLKPIIIQGNGNIFCDLDCIIPFEVTSETSINVDLPMNLSDRYNITANLEVMSFRDDNSYYQHLGTYLYKTSINSGDTGSISSLINELGSTSYTVSPSVGTRNKITLSTSYSEHTLKGFLHLYT